MITRTPRLRFVAPPIDGVQAPGPGVADATPAPTEPPSEDGEEADEPLREEGVNALRSEREARRKAEKEAATLRRQIEDATKTAEQRAADALAEAQDKAARAERKAAQYEAAQKAGLPLELAPRLVGDDLEAMVKDAKSLTASLAKMSASQAPTGPQAPKPDRTVGASGTVKPVTLGDAIIRHYAEK
jgi:hypothetical protein